MLEIIAVDPGTVVVGGGAVVVTATGTTTVEYTTPPLTVAVSPDGTVTTLRN